MGIDLFTFEVSGLFSTLVATAIFVAILRYIQWHWNRRTLYKAASKLKGPPCLPFLGSALIVPFLLKDFYTVVPKFFKKYGNPVRVWMGPELFIGINNPDDAESIFNSPFCVDRCNKVSYIKILGNGLVTGRSAIWKSHRKLIQPTMNQQILDTFVDIFAKESKILADSLMEDVGKHCDIFDRMFKSAMDSICETTIGMKMNSQSNENTFGAQLQRYLALAFNRAYKIWLYPEFIFKRTRNYKILTEMEKFFREFSDNIVKTKREERRNRKLERTESEDATMVETNSKKKSFLEFLLDISDRNSSFTDQDIHDETITIIIAGADTTSNTNCFILTCLAIYPEVQEKVYKEVIDQLGPDRLVEKSDLAELKYLEQVIKESMRLFPVLPILIRECQKDVKLNNGVVIPSGSKAAVLVHTIQTDERYWEEPNKFNPARFLPENTAKRHPLTFLAFSAGPRNCVGQKYGMMSMKTTMAILVRKYKFYSDYKSMDDFKIKLEGNFTKPRDGFNIRLVERD